MNPPTMKMSKMSQGKRQRSTQVEKLKNGIFDSMKPEQIISACKSGKWNVENLIMRGDIPVLPLAQYFQIDTKQSTGAIKYAIVDCLKEIVKSSHKGK